MHVRISSGWMAHASGANRLVSSNVPSLSCRVFKRHVVWNADDLRMTLRALKVTVADI
jgi:hypothetical protein